MKCQMTLFYVHLKKMLSCFKCGVSFLPLSSVCLYDAEGTGIQLILKQEKVKESLNLFSFVSCKKPNSYCLQDVLCCSCNAKVK